MEPGEIRGFIGRNGAGKTTTLKALMNLVHPDAGSVRFFGLPMAEEESAIKQRIGFAMGEMDYYTKKRLSTIAAVTSRFYEKWDQTEYQRYLSEFALDPAKTPSQLSAGMRVKFALTLALSHHAELLILDEPTSGLDPVSREEILDIFLSLQDQGVAILFSTHITTDLEKCADTISYLRGGHLVADDTLERFLARYRLVELPAGMDTSVFETKLVGRKRGKRADTALVLSEEAAALPEWANAAPCDLEAIMVHLEQMEVVEEEGDAA